MSWAIAALKRRERELNTIIPFRIDPFESAELIRESSGVGNVIKKRRARGVKHDSDEDLKDSEKMPHEFDYSSAEEEAVKTASEGNQDNYETPPRKKRCIE